MRTLAFLDRSMETVRYLRGYHTASRVAFRLEHRRQNHRRHATRISQQSPNIFFISVLLYSVPSGFPRAPPLGSKYAEINTREENSRSNKLADGWIFYRKKEWRLGSWNNAGGGDSCYGVQVDWWPRRYRPRRDRPRRIGTHMGLLPRGPGRRGSIR